MKNRLLYPCVVKEKDGVFYANFVNFDGVKFINLTSNLNIKR